MYAYRPTGVCSQQIAIDLDGDVVKHVEFYGGCDGNLQAVSKLIQGMTIDEVDKQLSGIRCGRKNTSCPDQLVKALHAIEEYRQAHPEESSEN